MGFQFDDVQEWGFSSSLFKSGALKVGEFKMFKCETLEFRMSKVGFTGFTVQNVKSEVLKKIQI